MKTVKRYLSDYCGPPKGVEAYDKLQCRCPLKRQNWSMPRTTAHERFGPSRTAEREDLHQLRADLVLRVDAALGEIRPYEHVGAAELRVPTCCRCPERSERMPDAQSSRQGEFPTCF